MLSSVGYLHIANIIEADSLLPRGDQMRYVCIVNNPLLGAFVQGDDQKVRPIARGTGLGRRRLTRCAGMTFVYNSLWEIHRRATERHLPCEITHCYRPPDTGERAPFQFPARQASIRFTYPERMEG